MGKSELFSHFADRFEVKRTQAREFFDELTTLAEKELKRSGEFPPLVHHMVAIGERTGALEEMLTNVANAYESQVETKIGALTSLLEPIMIVVIGAIIGAMIIALYMPIFSLMNVVS